MADTRLDGMETEIANVSLSTDHFIPQGDGTVLIKNADVASLIEARVNEYDQDPTVDKFHIVFKIGYSNG